MRAPRMKNSAQRIAAALAVTALSFLPVSTPAVAAPQHYTISFTVSPSSPISNEPTGSFDYDPTVPSFSSFIVEWGGLNFDLTSAANGPVITGGSTACGVSGAAASFLLLNKDACLGGAEQLGPKKWQVDLFAGGVANFAFVGSGGERTMFFNASAPGSFSAAAKCERDVCAVGFPWQISLTEPNPVPLPGTLALIGIGFGALAASRRRKR